MRRMAVGDENTVSVTPAVRNQWTWLEMLQGCRPRAVPLLLSLSLGIKKCIWDASPRSAPLVVRVECLASALLMWKHSTP